jgi:hypothetical protein
MLWSAVICSAQAPLSQLSKKQHKESEPANQNEPAVQEPMVAPLYNQLLDNQQLENRPFEAEQKEGELKPSEQEPMPAAIMASEPTRSLGIRSFIDDVYHSARNRFGFSLNAYQAYTDVSSDRWPSQSANISSFTPRIFFNLGKRKSVLYLNLGAGYRHYYGHNGSNSWDNSASAYYTYQLVNTKRSTFQIADRFNSAYNDDASSFFSPDFSYSPIQYNYNFSNKVVFNRQRITENSLTVTYSYRLCRRCTFSLFSELTSYRYSQQDLNGYDAFDVGASFGFHLNKWLDLTNSYSVNLNRVNDEFSQSRISQLRIAGLNFHLGRHWRAWIGGGASMLGSQNENFTHSSPSVDGGIGYDSANPSFSITHTRGYAWAEGISEILKTSVTTAQLGYRITPRVNAGLQASYYQGREQNSDGSLNTFSEGGMLEFAPRRDLSLSINSFYQNQISHNFSVQGLHLNRFNTYLSLQYIWPSRR